VERHELRFERARENRLKPGFGRFFRGACNRFWNVLLRKDAQVWENDVLMVMGLQAYKTTGDALSFRRAHRRNFMQ
jgi:hypothetical protein